jgi:glycosyltransferase involved in cell wall biosynthesis
MKISYAITAHNEAEELDKLLTVLIEGKDPEDEIIVQMDTTATAKVKYVCDKHPIKSITFGLNNDFATFKNNIKNECSGDYIFFIDADEYPSEHLLKLLKQVLTVNTNVDCYGVPRVNTVKGLTEEHIKTWGWRVDDKGYVNWPDYQTRVCKNVPEIKWVGKVHERLEGFTTFSVFPSDYYDWALMHPKTIERQEKQNQFYSTL